VSGEDTSNIAAKIYSAVMDDLTCISCAVRDGIELELDDQSLFVPNPDCTCEEGCRCCWVWRTHREPRAKS
jgi:hypothetical protein